MAVWLILVCLMFCSAIEAQALTNNKLGGTRKSVELAEEVNPATILDQSKF